MNEDGIVTVALTYEDADLQGADEADLQLRKLNTATATYEPAGTNDAGLSEPTGVLDDYGIDGDANSAWAEVSEVGTFAVGFPQLASDEQDAGEQDAEEQDTTMDADEMLPTGCGANGGGICGTMGMLFLPMTILGLMGMRRSQPRGR